jgi:hypothetical protein
MIGRSRYKWRSLRAAQDLPLPGRNIIGYGLPQYVIQCVLFAYIFGLFANYHGHFSLKIHLRPLHLAFWNSNGGTGVTERSGVLTTFLPVGSEIDCRGKRQAAIIQQFAEKMSEREGKWFPTLKTGITVNQLKLLGRILCPVALKVIGVFDLRL